MLEANPGSSGTIPGQTVADRAALIVTFYGQRDRMLALAQWFTSEETLFGLRPVANSAGKFHNSSMDEEVIMWCFDPIGVPAHDTQVVQLILNKSGPAGDAWRKLIGSLSESGIQNALSTLADEGGLWGYTIIFQAVLYPEVNPSDAINLLLPSIGLLDDHKLRAYPLAECELLGGRIWLLDVPISGHDVQAACVYVALVSGEQNDQFVTEVLCGPNAALLMPDLIAHKAYYYVRQYNRSDWIGPYRQKVFDLRNMAGMVLRHRSHRVSLSPRSSPKRLKQSFLTLVDAVSLLDVVRISLEEQKRNYDDWQPQVLRGELLAYHRQHIQVNLAHVDLLIEMGRGALEIIRTSLDILQSELERNVATSLAIAAIVVGIPQLISENVAKEVILSGIVSPLYQRLGGTPLPSYTAFHALLAQLFVIIALTLLVLLYVRLRYRDFEG